MSRNSDRINDRLSKPGVARAALKEQARAVRAGRAQLGTVKASDKASREWIMKSTLDAMEDAIILDD